MRNVWKYYFSSTEGIIFVIDANAHHRVSDVKEEIWSILQDESAKKIPMLIYSNKHDLENPKNILENSNNNSENKISENLGHNSIARVDFYQEENVRLGSELLDTKKKFEILKSEIEKYEEQRSNLISKINSVNDAINDTNVLTNVFDNNVKPKIQITDHNKIEKKDKGLVDLNEQVKNIFSK